MARELGNSLKKRSDEFGLISLYFIKCSQKGSTCSLATDCTLAKSGLLLSHSVRLRSAPAPTRCTYPSGLRLLRESSASPCPENHAGKGGITGNYPEMDVCRIDLPTCPLRLRWAPEMLQLRPRSLSNSCSRRHGRNNTISFDLLQSCKSASIYWDCIPCLQWFQENK
jgi:hypothetical protein